MITDIPDRNDFEEQGLTLLNLAWDSVTALLLDYREAEEWDGIVEEEQTDHYKKAAQKPLAIATALLQQGTEFLVKAAIAEVSPLLLIAGSPSSWPKKCDKVDTGYSSFKTADANDLLTIHDTVASSRFSGKFIQTYTQMRHVRNTIFHSVDKKMKFSEKQIIIAILEITTELLGKRQWVDNRNEYLDSIPMAAWAYDRNRYQLSREIILVIDLIEPSEAVKHLGFNKRQRRYICPGCAWAYRDAHSDDTPRTAQLKPNQPNSTSVYCIVCRSEYSVIRSKCTDLRCKGNVICNDDDYDPECLTCGSLYDK